MRIYKVIIESKYGNELLQLAKSAQEAKKIIENKYDFVVLDVRRI